MLFGGDFRPGICLHVAKFGFLPGEFGVAGEVLSGGEVAATRVASGGGEGKFRSHRRVSGFILYGACRAIRGLPCAHSTRREVNVAAQSTFAGLGFSSERIDVIREKLLRRGDIDFAFIFPHQLFPTFVAGISA